MSAVARSRPRLLLALFVLLSLLGSSAGSAAAQSAPAEGMGRITGDLALGTAGATWSDDLRVQFIVLVGSEVEGTVDAEVVRAGDQVSFVIDVPAGPDRRYVPRVVYQGVSSFGAPVTVTDEQPEVVASVPAVFETTTEPPDLSIAETVVTVVALDRGTGELGLIREDLVLNPTDRVYVGGAGGITLRLPAPESTIDAAGENADGTFALEGGVVTTTTPLQASGGTSIVTRYLVTYDLAEDAYVLRVTTPVAAQRLVVRVPDEYVHDARVEGAGAEGPADSLTVGEGDPVALRTFVLEGAAPGDSLVVRLDGLELRRNSNPLTETPGSLIAGAIALLVVGSASAYAVARGRTTPG